jgi:hypothetical protein
MTERKFTLIRGGRYERPEPELRMPEPETSGTAIVPASQLSGPSPSVIEFLMRDMKKDATK